MASFKKFYKGFSTRYYEEQGGGFSLSDVACIEEDIMNEIFTERGSRLYMPTYGTRIPLLTFEPNDAATMDVIREDLQTVVDHDPRVTLLDMAVMQAPDSNMIIAVIRLGYIEFQVTQDLYIEINSQ
jgi:phage baseplate assembly protein W